MEKKETTPRRVERRSYEERNKDKRKQASGNFGTMIPRDLYEEINEFLAKNHITNVTNKESKLCNIHGTILLYFTSRIRKMQHSAFSDGEASGIPASSLGGGNYSRREKYRQENP